MKIRDEPKFEKFGSSCVYLSVKCGGSFDIFGACISASGVGDLIKIDGIMNAKMHEQHSFKNNW